MAPRVGRILNSQLVPLMLGHARRAGVSTSRWTERFGLPSEAEKLPELRLPLETFHRFTDELAEALGNPFLGVHVAATLPPGAYGLMEFIAHSSATVREALLALERYSTLLNEIVEFSLEERRGEATFRHRIPGVPLCTGPQANEFMLVYAVRGIRQLTGDTFAPRKVWFAHPRKGPMAPLAEHLGAARIEHGRGENGFSFDAAVLDRPVVGAAPALHAFLTAQAQDKVASLGAGLPLPGRVRSRIEQALAKGPVSVEAIARGLHMSARSLQRKLGEDGTSFQALLDEVRRGQAMRLLEDSSKGLSEVAFRLGYQDVRAFSRAFKRWTGGGPRSTPKGGAARTG